MKVRGNGEKNDAYPLFYPTFVWNPPFVAPYGHFPTSFLRHDDERDSYNSSGDGYNGDGYNGDGYGDGSEWGDGYD